MMQRSTVLKFLRSTLALLIVAVLIYLASARELVDALRQLGLDDVIGLAILAVALIYVSALKWKLFIESLGSPVSVLRLFGLYLVGYFVNLLMPSYVGGDVVRSWYIGKRVGQHEALAATILERYTGLLAMILLAVVFMWFVEQVTFEIKIAIVIIAAGFLVITFLGLSKRPLRTLERFQSLKPVVSGIHKIQAGFDIARRNHRLLAVTVALSLLYHCLTVINTVIAARAVGWDNPPVWDLFVVLPIILLVGSIPATPNGLGVQEGAFFFFLLAIGASPAQALGVPLVLRAKSYVLALAGAIVWLRIRNEESG